MNQDLGDDWHHKYHKDVHPPSTKATWRLQAQAALQVTFRKITNSDDTLTIIYFNLYNCKELTDTDITQYLDGKENKKTNKYLLDKGMMEYLQIFADIVIKVMPAFLKVHLFNFNEIYNLSKKTYFVFSFHIAIWCK